MYRKKIIDILALFHKKKTVSLQRVTNEITVKLDFGGYMLIMVFPPQVFNKR